MFITLQKDEARRRLEAAGLRLVHTYAEQTVEVWRHNTGVEVRLQPELDGTGAYEETMIRLVEDMFG